MAHKDPERGWLPIPEEQKPGEMLADVKVLDISHHIAGPYLTKLLADYGADVIKVENPDGGDIARRTGPFPGDIPHPEKGGTFLFLNANKRGITLNLGTETGRRILRELVRDADILVENFAPRRMAEWGLTYESLEAVNPRLVMTSISNFGQWGPYRDLRATEIVIAAMGGPMISVGVEGREPLKYYGSVSAVQAGLDGLVATMAAFVFAREMGMGQHIDVSMFEALLGSIDRRLSYIVGHQYSGRTETYRAVGGAASMLISGVGVPIRDGFVLFSSGALDQRNFARFARWVGHPELIDDPDFATIDRRMRPEQYAMFDGACRSYLLDHTMAEVMESMLEHDIPGGCVFTVANVVDSPQMAAREFFVEIDHPVVGTLRYPGAQFRASETPWRLRRPAPLLGEHNEEIYCGLLGYSRQDLVLLRERNVI